jgi:hypothetical protein
MRNGQNIRLVREDSRDALKWPLPDMFAPYRAEYQDGAAFESLWMPWLSIAQEALNNLAQ